MLRWPGDIKPITQEEIQRAISCPAWQNFRLSMKGKPTSHKLDMLWARRDMLLTLGEQSPEHQRLYDVQVYNYLNALLRGGQLSSDLKVVR